MKFRIYLLACLISLLPLKFLRAEISFAVSIEDSQNHFVHLHADVEAAVQAAGAIWAEVFEAPALVELDVLVRLGTNVNRAGGRSGTSVYVGHDGQRDVWEQGAAAKIRTGIDPNPGEPDVILDVERDYLLNELWFDPDPLERTASVPSNRTDAISVFLHEFGHAFIFNGWIDWETGERPDTYHSNFDALTKSPLGAFRFLGLRTMHLYGGQIPLTSGNIYHFGNRSGEPGNDLVPDFMNGIVYNRGTRYDLSAHTLAVAEDLNVPVALTWERWSRLAFREHRSSSPLQKEEDTDGNGIPNLLEFLFGTDPRNARSRKTLSVNLDGSDVTITFPLVRSVRGYGLQLETSSGHLEKFVTQAVFNPSEADAPLQVQSSVLDVGPAEHGFARIVPVAVPAQHQATSTQAGTILITGPTPILQDCFACWGD